MTNDEIDAAVAEACNFVGWQEFQPNKNGPKFRFWDYPKNWMGPSREPWVPKFCSDLNAMHEAEKVLTIQQEKNYFVNLEGIVGDLIWYRTVGKTYRATARQRAEAFLRTLGKWEEVQE